MKLPVELNEVNQKKLALAEGPRIRIALGLAILADVLQMIGFPLFIEGAASPADDLVDLAMAGILTFLLGWHWEFLPSAAAKLIPGVDMVPLWTLAVGNVWRRSKKDAATEPTIPAPTIDAHRTQGDLRP
ncbi:hypothetical protein [Occallatibacter riparius]|uniref:Uncharacterized protein n=1 Tax=Occallatibacter riparius TaxID=1002689 RepID=A0A9J7BTQ7_9BACT|nr:hypothetical protein [Occallatibacter riparius]UWZ85977.1 hypothetical protein MOP44_08530 [Occallatibacter riparius]